MSRPCIPATERMGVPICLQTMHTPPLWAKGQVTIGQDWMDSGTHTLAHDR